MPIAQPSQDQRRTEYEAYLASPEWQALRLQALERDGHACRVCNSTKLLDVHHRTYERFGHEDLNDLTVLCRKCHEKHHGGSFDKPKPKRQRKPRRAAVEKRSNILEAVVRMEPGREYTTLEIMRMADTTNPTQALNGMVGAGKLKHVAKRTWVKPHQPGQPGSLDKFSQRAHRDREARENRREEIRTVSCPTCGAEEGQRCVNSLAEPRKANHQERVTAHASKGLAA